MVGSVIVKETKVKSTEKKHEPKEIHVNPVVVEKEAVLETTPEKIKTEIEVVQQEQPISEEVEKESVEIEKETSAETDVSLSSAKKKSKKKYWLNQYWILYLLDNALFDLTDSHSCESVDFSNFLKRIRPILRSNHNAVKAVGIINEVSAVFLLAVDFMGWVSFKTFYIINYG